MSKSYAVTKNRSNRPVSPQDVPFEIGQMSKRSRLHSLLGKAFNDLFRHGKRKSRRPSFALEVLEPRLLLAADPAVFSLSATGALTGQLTGQDDNIVVALYHDDAAHPDGVAQDGGLIINVTLDGVSTQYGKTVNGNPGIGVTSIDLQGLA